MPAIGRFRYLEASPSSTERFRGTLVLLHAFPLNARMWEPQLSIAADGWRIIAPHMRGADGGIADSPVTSMEDYAGDVIDLLDALHIHEAVVCGLSMGGYVAFAMFRHAPRYIQGLILSDTRAEADTPDAVEGRKKLQAVAHEKGPSAVADEMIPKLVGQTSRATRPDVIDRVRSLILSNSSASISGALTALMSRPDSTPVLATIRCPTLVIVGEEDTVTPPALSEKLQHGIAGAALVTVPLAGHLSSLEQPNVFNQALARFLAHRV